MLGRREPVPQRDERNHLFPVDRVGQADNTDLEHCWMVIERLLHFLWRDVGTATDDDLLGTPMEPKEPICVALYQVARPQPTVVECSLGCLQVLPVSNAIGRAQYLQF